jgi:hypothetical protein
MEYRRVQIENFEVQYLTTLRVLDFDMVLVQTVEWLVGNGEMNCPEKYLSQCNLFSRNPTWNEMGSIPTGVSWSLFQHSLTLNNRGYSCGKLAVGIFPATMRTVTNNSLNGTKIKPFKHGPTARFCMCELALAVTLRHEKGSITFFGRKKYATKCCSKWAF